MPSWIYLRGDPDAIMCDDAPDELLRRVEQAQDGFVPVANMPEARDDAPRTGYVRASDVVAILPLHPRLYEAELDDPADWYERYAPE